MTTKYTNIRKLLRNGEYEEIRETLIGMGCGLDIDDFRCTFDKNYREEYFDENYFEIYDRLLKNIFGKGIKISDREIEEEVRFLGTTAPSLENELDFEK